MPTLTLAVLLLGQAAPVTAPGTEIRAVTVTLLDEKGGPAGDVSADDVALVENGVPRDIASFKPDLRPLSVAILVDSSAGMGSSYRLNVVEAVVALVSRLPEGTRYALWTTGDRPTKVLDHTEDRAAASDVLRRVAPQGANYTLDGVDQAAADLRKLWREGDRRVMIAVTGTGPEFSYVDKLRAADRGEEDLDLFLGLQIDGAQGDFDTQARLSYVFDRLARATGGRYEVVLSAMGTDDALRKLDAHLRAGFRIAYATVPDLKKRKLELSVARPGTKVFLPLSSEREPSKAEP
jgi:hypothetical protein